MKTFIAIPALSWVYTEFMQSMLALDKKDAQLMIQMNSLVYDARNNIAWAAMQNNVDRILWLDSDMSFEPDLMERLNADMDKYNLDMVAGYFTSRTEAQTACAYKDIIWEVVDNKVRSEAVPLDKRPKGLVEVAGVGFGAVLTKVELFKAVSDSFGAPFYPLPYLGEDLSFCWRVNKLGRKIHCDGDIKVGHIGTHIYQGEN